jgi:hypothetical protein
MLFKFQMPYFSMKKKTTRKVKGKRPFRVFVAGFEKPGPIVARAKQALREGKNRSFIGADPKPKRFDLNALLIKAGIKKIPSNATLIEGCAVKALNQLAKGSQDVVFGGFVFHYLFLKPGCESYHERCTKKGQPCGDAFVKAAKRALKPGGRIILVQDWIILPAIDLAAQVTDMHFHAFFVPEEWVKRSKSKHLKDRANPRKSAKWIQNALDRNEITQEQVDAFMAKMGTNDKSKLRRPVVAILRKPFIGEISPSKKQKQVLIPQTNIPPELAKLIKAQLLGK